MDVYVDGSGDGRFCHLAAGMPPKIFVEEGLSNNQAEYKAVIAALTDIKQKDITIYSDSKLLVKQLNFEWAIKDEKLRDLAMEIWRLMEGRKVKIIWIPREENKAGKVLG